MRICEFITQSCRISNKEENFYKKVTKLLFNWKYPNENIRVSPFDSHHSNFSGKSQRYHEWNSFQAALKGPWPCRWIWSPTQGRRSFQGSQHTPAGALTVSLPMNLPQHQGQPRPGSGWSWGQSQGHCPAGITEGTPSTAYGPAHPLFFTDTLN